MLWFGVLMFTLANIVGAWMTWHLRAGSVPSWSMYALLPFSTTAWVILTKSKVIPLTTLSVCADVGVCLIYLLVFVFLGEKLTTTHMVGALFAMVGIGLMAS